MFHLFHQVDLVIHDIRIGQGILWRQQSSSTIGVSRCVVNPRSCETALQNGCSPEIVEQVKKMVKMYRAMLREGSNTQKLLELPIACIKRRGFKSPYIPSL